MSRIDRLIEDLCPDGVPYRELREVATYTKDRVESTNLDETNFVGVDNLLANKGGRVDAQYPPNTARVAAFKPGDILLGNIRPYLQKVWLADRHGGCSGDVLAVNLLEKFSGKLSPEFLYYLLSSDDFFAYNIQHAKGAKMPRGSKDAIMKYRIPIPPLKIQHAIVDILDQFIKLETELETELEAELEARKQQYEHYRNEVLTFSPDVSWVKLSNVVEYVNGKAHEKLADPDGEVAMVTARFISRNGEANRFLNLRDVLTPAVIGDVAMVLSDLPNGRALARTFYVDRDDSYAINQRVARLRVKDSNLTSSGFVYHFLDRNPKLLRYDNGFDQTHLSKSQVTGLDFPVLPLCEQERIVEILDKFDAFFKDLSSDISVEIVARRKQYEHYRDKLLTFKELAA